jgi:hypothetical protein
LPKSSRDKNLSRKVVLTGTGIGVVAMPAIFFLISIGTDWTNEKLMWLCINGICSGVIIGGGIGYLLTANDIRFW